MLKQYLKDIYKRYKPGDATEQSYYSDLEKLLKSFLNSKGVDPNITITGKKTEAGIPDFTIRKNKELIGYIEAKDLTIEDLQKVEDSEQIERYKKKLPNFILTNYFDFWLWRRDSLDEDKGQWIKKVRIGQPVSLKLGIPPPPQKEKEFFEFLQAFFSFYIPERKTAKSLAKELASRAQLIPSHIIFLLNDGKDEEIDRVYNAFKKYLIANLSKEDFADIYTQTIVYGLFAARLRYQGKDFNRALAADLIPRNIQVLHDTFSLISSNILPEAILPWVDDIATILAHADIEKIKEEMSQRKGGDDPLIHFYETFLAEYDPKKRKTRGVYYTPFPVVSYITRSINEILKEKFNKKLGFASDGVTILDPASGTLTFPASAIKIAKEEVDKSSNAGSWPQIVKNHILKDFYAFELLMAPYVIGHLKMSLVLEELGYKLKNNDRFQLYLTNTLDFKKYKQMQDPYIAGLSKEAVEAHRIKEEEKILVIMGNPPYSVSSANVLREESDYKNLYESYKEVVRKEEKNIQPLSDDYIKFIAFAHWKIKQTGKGVIGMITNNSYLDGLIHRDMRRKLAEDFNEIYILNLHGSLKRQEKTPEGGKDENVFDIQQGVGIVLLVKKEGLDKKVRYSDLYGLREEKSKFLKGHDIKITKWQELESKKPSYFFIPKDFGLEEKYAKFFSIKNIFSILSSGVKTHRDDFILDYSKESLKRKLLIFYNTNYDNQFIKETFNLKDTGTWKLNKARSSFMKKGLKDKLFKFYSYRPFDTRWIYYDKNLIERARIDDIWNLSETNIALLITKQLSTSLFRHIFVSQYVPDICSISLQTKESAYIFPLYLKKVQHKANLFSDQKRLAIEGQPALDEKKVNKIPNIKQDFYNLLKENYKKNIFPEEILYYIYGILYSNIYRKKYNEFLKINFPKIPFTKNYKLFQKVAKLGKELVDLHLLKSKKLKKSDYKFPKTRKEGINNGVEKVEYSEKEKRVYINNEQYFENISPEIWNYYIGGYQVLHKWLKDRKDKILSTEDVNHYLKIITVIKNTIDVQKEIDKIYPKIEKRLLK